MQRYRGFCYTTASHTEEEPRARVILLASRPMSRDECENVSETLEAEIELSVGLGEVKFDPSVYRGEQPIYTPVVGAKTYSFQGKAVAVDTLLNISQRRQTAFQFGGSTVNLDGLLRTTPPKQMSARSAELPAAMGGGIGGYVMPDRVDEGERNPAILSFAGHLRGRGVPEDLIPGMALDFNRSRCTTPLDDDEVISIASRYKTTDPIQVVDASGWPEPEDIKATLPPAMPFDQLLLPKVFRAWISDIADRMQCPIEFLAVGAMVAAGAAVGNRAGVQPKQRDTGWVEVPNIWGAVVGRPGVMKSPALAQVLMPLRQLEAAAQNAFTTTKAQYEIDQMKYVADKKAIEAQIKKGATILPSQLPVVPVEPQPQRYLVNDSTYQKLGAVLSGNPHGLLVFQDELSGLLVRLDSNGQESSRAFYLEAWNGQQDYTFDRMERGTVRIPRLCFSLMGGLQPSKLRGYLRSAVYGGKGDDGLAQRLQMLVYPDISPKWKQVDRLPDVAAATAVDDVFKRLASLDPIALGARQHYTDSIPVFGFTEDAQDLFNTWWEELENDLRGNEHHPPLEAHISKYRKLVPALALLSHLIIGNHGDISIHSLKSAICWQEFLLTHANRAYASVTSGTMDAAKALSRHIQRGALKDGFTVRGVYKNNCSPIGRAL